MNANTFFSISGFWIVAIVLAHFIPIGEALAIAVGATLGYLLAKWQFKK